MRTLRLPFHARLTAALLIPTLALPACADDDAGGSGDSGGRLVVAVAFTPIEEIVRAVAGDLVEIVTIVPPGESAHEYEPTARQVADLERADVVFYFGDDFQPTVERSIENLPDDVVAIDLLTTLDLLPASGDDHADESTEEHAEHGEFDPHVWLDPKLVREMTASVLATLGSADPSLDERLADAASRFTAQLDALDADHVARLTSCDSVQLVTTHRAFAYFAATYDLEQVSIEGITPSGEPSAQSLEDITAFVEREGVSTIFVEGTVDDDLVNVVAEATGADIVAISDLETFTPEQREAGATYLSVMRDNLDRIATGLGCG